MPDPYLAKSNFDFKSIVSLIIGNAIGLSQFSAHRLSFYILSRCNSKAIKFSAVYILDGILVETVN